jgi:hypothetical protein
VILCEEEKEVIVKSSLKPAKRDINWVRNLPGMKKIIEDVFKVGAFGRSWTKDKGSPLYGSHILLMTADEVVSIFGRDPL